MDIYSPDAHKNSTRYPYTYSADLIRSIRVCDGQLMSRADAAQITRLIAAALGVNKQDFCSKLADYYLDHEGEITAQFIAGLPT